MAAVSVLELAAAATLAVVVVAVEKEVVEEENIRSRKSSRMCS